MGRRAVGLPPAQTADGPPARMAKGLPLSPAGRRYGGKAALAPLAALAATTMLAQGDQSSLAQAVTGIQHQFGASDQLLGLIPFGMAVCGGIGGESPGGVPPPPPPPRVPPRAGAHFGGRLGPRGRAVAPMRAGFPAATAARAS